MTRHDRVPVRAALCAAVLCTAVGCAPPGKGPESSDWEPSPATPADGLVGPHQGTDQGWGWIGKEKETKKYGDPGSKLHKSFNCRQAGQEGEWCTLHVIVDFFQADGERVKITVTPQGGARKSVYVKTGAATEDHHAGKEYVISVPKCDTVDVDIEFTEGTTANIQSWAAVKLSQRACTAKDETNAAGGLVDENGKDLPQPPG